MTSFPRRSPVIAREDGGRKRWLCIDRYFGRGPVSYDWTNRLYPFATSSYHATLEDWLKWIGEAGFAVERLHEPSPSEEALERHPDLEDAAKLPYYLMLEVKCV